MTTYRLARQGDIDLCFYGDLLAHVTSQTDDKTQRWTEIRVYRTDTNKWVTEEIGRSIVRGETDRRKVTVCSTPVDVRTALRRTDAGDYLTHLALDALDAAAEADPELASITGEWV